MKKLSIVCIYETHTMYQVQAHTNFNETESCIRSQTHFLVASRIDDLFSNLEGSVGRSDSGVVVVGAEFSLSSSSSTNLGLAAVDPI